MTRRTRLIAFACATAVVAVPAVATAAADAPTKNIVQTAAGVTPTTGPNGFSTLLRLATDAGLAGRLSSKPDITVFAPTNRAFNALPKATLDAVTSDRALLRKVLLYHVVTGKVPASRVVTLNGRRVRTLAGRGEDINVAIRGRNVFLNGSTRVTATDINATNGVIHVVNRVLIPPSAR
jgi:uncharacterized surface protein with fasciclin (FAS1) repeats